MTLRSYLILMSIGTAICWAAWFFVIGSVDPIGAGALEFFFFYVSLFFALMGTFSVIGFLARRWLVGNDDIAFHHVKRTFRQGLIMASFLILLLLLRQVSLLRWWNAVLLVILLLIVEGLVFSQRKYNNVM